MNRPTILLSVLLGMALSSPVLAQSDRDARDAAFARTVMHDFASCIVKYESDLASRMVLLESRDMTEEELRRLQDRRCLGAPIGQLRMRGSQYSGALAEALIRKQLAGRPAIDPAGTAALRWPMPMEPAAYLRSTGRPAAGKPLADAQAFFLVAAADAVTGQLGECVVRANPAGALAVLSTRLDWPEEMAALRSLSPAISGCVRKGSRVTLNRSNLRSGIAISYYRLAAASGLLALKDAR